MKEEELIKDLEIVPDEDVDLSDDENIYSEGIRDRLLEDDEMSPEEAGFMKGYDDAYV